MTFLPRSRACVTLNAFALCAPLAAAMAQSGTPAPMTPMANPDPRLATIHARMNGVRTPGSASLSPDGSLLAWTLRTADGTQLHLTDLARSSPAQEKTVAPAGTSTKCSNSEPAWSPDSTLLAFASTCFPAAAQSEGATAKEEKDVQPQFFLYSRASGETRQLTHLSGIFQAPHFSPDGHTLAFLFVENATRSAGALAAMKPWSGVIGEDGVEVQRVASASVPDGSFHFISPAHLHAFEFDWSPKSDAVTYTAAAPPGENNWWVAQLYTQSLTGSPVSILDTSKTAGELHDLQIAVPRWSPDGKRIAFIGGLMSDQGSTGGDVFTISPGGGGLTNITPNIDGTPTFITWLEKNHLGLSEDRRGHSLLTVWDPDARAELTRSDLGETNITGGPIKMAFSHSLTDQVAFVKSGHHQAPEVFVGMPDALKQITHLNDGIKSSVKVESVEWENQGFHVQGWLTYPKDYDPKQKYPLIVEVHGGPSASASSRFGGAFWSELGYFIFAPNPRGSFGQGEKFTAANVKDFGYGDLHDILAGMDAIEKKVSIDTRREGLTGWSYGGFMTMFGVTQTHRFRAAVAGAGISDWKSYYGENSIDQWMLPFFGKTVYDDPAVYARSSAIEFIKNVTTPTLVVVGDRDGECPAPQSFEFFHALRAQNVKTQLVVYPNEGHGFRDPAHVRDLEARQVAWFEQNMPSADKTAARPRPVNEPAHANAPAE